MKDLFIITSAIMVPNAEPWHRAMQTAHTIDSINARIPDAEIWLCDSATTAMPAQILNLLVSDNVKLKPFNTDPEIHKISKYAESYIGIGGINTEIAALGIIKNATESYVMCQLLKEDLSGFKRVFKISGRYALTTNFNRSNHIANGNVILAKAQKSYLPDRINEIEKIHMCMLWSFCTSIQNTILKVFESINNEVMLYANTGRLTDIEHGLYKHIDPLFKHEIETLGVLGLVDNKRPISI